MKPWIFKGLAYLATCGAAATTVLLTASSVGLKKSVAETFPNLSGLIQNRPDVKEDLLTPKDPPPKPPTQEPPPPPPPPPSTGKQDDPGKAQDDPTGQKNDATPDPNAANSPGQSAPGGAPGGAGGAAGGIDCVVGAEGLKNVATALSAATRGAYTGMDIHIQGAANCLNKIFAAPQPGAGPAGPGDAVPQLSGPQPNPT